VTLTDMLRAALLFLAVAVHSGLSYRSVCYYTNWAQYRNSKGKFVPEDVDPNLCTHVIYAFAKIVGTDVVAFEWNDESTAWSKGMYERMMNLKTQNPNLKIMLGVGGWNMASAPFSAIVGDANKRQTFAQNVVAFLRKHNFDGFDNDWEYPANRGSPPEDKQNDVLFMQELRRAFDEDSARTGAPRLLLSTAISVGKDTIDSAYDIPSLSRLVDFFNIMSYDIHGSFEKNTGHNAPLYANSAETGDDRHLNVEWALNYYLSLGMPRDKMNMGIPTYGRSFTLDNSGITALGAPAGNAGVAGRYTGEKGFISYYEICEKLQHGAKVYKEPSSHAKYLVEGNQWIGYDDVNSVREKACFAKNMGVGGVMYWALDLDDFKGSTCNEGPYPLINAGNKAFQTPGSCPNSGPNPGTVAPATPQPYRPQTPAPTARPYQPQTPAPTARPYQPQTPAPTARPYQPQTAAPTARPYQPNPGTNVVPSAGFSCVGRADDFYEDPKTCSSYYICANQKSFKVDCARGLMYNSVTRHCDWANNVQCGFQTLPPQQPYGPLITSRPVGPTRAPITSAPYTRAPVTQAPYTQAPYTQAPYTQAPYTQAPYTQAPYTQAPYRPTSAPVTRGPLSSVSCATSGDGLFPHSDCHRYIQCSAGSKFVMTCANKLVFNPQTGSCDYPINVPNCP